MPSLPTPTSVLIFRAIERRVARIASIARGEVKCPSKDVEAHAEEDALYRDVLQVIAEGTPQAAELAKATLATREIPFLRWYE